MFAFTYSSHALAYFAETKIPKSQALLGVISLVSISLCICSMVIPVLYLFFTVLCVGGVDSNYSLRYTASISLIACAVGDGV